MRRKAEFDIISTFYPEMKPAWIHATVSHECTFHRDLRSVHLRNREPDGAMKAETGNILCLAHRDARLQPIPPLRRRLIISDASQEPTIALISHIALRQRRLADLSQISLTGASACVSLYQRTKI